MRELKKQTCISGHMTNCAINFYWASFLSAHCKKSRLISVSLVAIAVALDLFIVYIAFFRVNRDTIMATNSHNCPLCESFASTSMKGIVRHIGLVHSHELDFRVTCGVSGCLRTYYKFNSFKKHMYVKHRDSLHEHATNVVSYQAVLGSNDCYTPQDDDDEEHESFITQRDRSTALFLLKAREIHKISQSALDHLLGDMAVYMDMIKERLMENVIATLQRKGINMEDDLELLRLTKSPEVTDPFSSLHSEYLQRQYFIKHFNLVVSIIIVLKLIISI